jgi:hypothetical protein
MGFFRYMLNVKKRNDDPNQLALANLFMEYAEQRKTWEDVFTFLESQIGTWPREELEERIVHAIATARGFRPDLYPAMKELGNLIIVGANQRKT